MFEATAKYAKLRMKEWKGQSIAVTDWVQHRLSDFLFAPAHWRQPAVRKWYLAGNEPRIPVQCATRDSSRFRAKLVPPLPRLACPGGLQEEPPTSTLVTPSG
ncbi:hypothetical protein MRX96_022875 [Rhipicephalus microplus]